MVAHLLVRLGGDEEIGRHDLGALVQKLEEGVLAVGAGLAPDDRAGAVFDQPSVAGHALAVRFHVELLQMRGEAREALVVGQHRMGAEIPDVAVPDAEQPHDHRHVLGERRVAEMLVHRARAGEEAAEILAADGDGERQADRRPDRIAPADPVPEAEDALGADAELGDLLRLVEMAAKCSAPPPRRAGRRARRAPKRRWSSSPRW